MTQYIIPDDTVQFLIGTAGSTGAATNADATPVVEVRERADGGQATLSTATAMEDNGTSVVSILNQQVGLYTVSVPTISEFGFEPGRNYVVHVSADVSGVTGVDGVAAFIVDPVRKYPRVEVPYGGADPESGLTPRLILGARKYGPGANGWTIDFQSDGTGAGSITGSAPTFVIHYEPAVTTIGNLRTLLSESTGLRVVYGTDAELLEGSFVADNDVFTLAGGADEESEYNMLASGRAQSATATTLVLASGTDFTADDQINGASVTIIAGTGANQSRMVLDYANATDTVTVDTDWGTTPDATSTYRVDRRPSGMAVALWKNGIPNNLVSGRVDVTVGAMQTNVLTDAATASDFENKIADVVWDEATFGHGTAGTFGKLVQDINTAVGVVDDFLDTEIAAIKAKTDNLPSDPADESLIIAATDAIMARLGSPAGASVSADIAALGDPFENIGEGSHTYGDLIRLMVSVLAGKVGNFTTNTLAFKALDGTTTRLTVTKDATGRTVITVGTLT